VNRTITSSRNFKKNLAAEISSLPLDQKSFPFERSVKFHGAPIKFYFQSHDFYQEFINWLPLQWQNKTLPADSAEIYFENPRPHLGTKRIEFWEEDPNPDCELLGREVVIQRDFLGIHSPSKQFRILCRQKIEDGFFNGLRWALPWVLKESSVWILHSCSVVDEHGDGHLFVGHSGAGKTTIAKRSHPRLVLGDDMNGIRSVSNQIKVFSAAVGQNPKFCGPLDREFPLKNIFILQKSHKNEAFPLKKITALRNLLASTPVVDLIHWESHDFQSLWNDLKKVVQITPCYNLYNSKDGDIWELINRI